MTPIDRLINSEPSDFNKEIDNILKDKLSDALAARKIEIAKNFIKDEENENEDVSDT